MHRASDDLCADVDEARVTYSEWVAIHTTGCSPEPAQIEQVTEAWLSSRPSMGINRAAGSTLRWRNVGAQTRCDMRSD